MTWKKVLGILFCVVLITGLCTGCEKRSEVTAKGEEQITLNIVHIASETDSIHKGWNYFKDELEKRSNGRFKVTIYGNKSISNSDNEDAEKVQQGICEMTSVPTSSLAAIGNIKEYQVFDYPYLFQEYDDYYKVLDSDMAADWSDRLAKRAGIRALGGYSLGWCAIGSTKKLETMKDYKGQKIRTMASDLQIATINSFKASATIVNYGEVFTALQQGTVDGLMTSATLMVSDKFYEVIDYIAVTKPMAILHVPIVNEEWYNNLPPDMRKIYDECIEDYLSEIRKYEEEADSNALRIIEKSGTEIVEYSEPQMKEFVQASQDVYEENIDIAGKETVEAVQEMLKK